MQDFFCENESMTCISMNLFKGKWQSEIPTQKRKRKFFLPYQDLNQEPVCYRSAMLTPFYQHCFGFEIKCNVNFNKAGLSPKMCA